MKKASGEFPGGPIVRTQCFQCGGPGLTSGWETKILQAVQHPEIFLIKKKNFLYYRKDEWKLQILC